jgi:hypothetical protein
VILTISYSKPPHHDYSVLGFLLWGCVIVLPSVGGSADVVDVTPLETIWLFENVFFGVES